MNKIKLILAFLVTIIFLFACSKEIKEVNLEEVYKDFEATNNQLPDMVTVDEDMLENYYGIDPADCKQYIIKISVEATITDEFALIEGIDEEAANRIEERMEKRLKYKEDEADGYLPDQYAIIKECSVVRKGNYVVMIISPQSADYMGIYNSYFE